MLRQADKMGIRINKESILGWICFGWAAIWLVLQLRWLYIQQALPMDRIPGNMTLSELLFGNGPLLLSLLGFTAIVLLLHALFAWINRDAFRSLLAPRIATFRTRLIAQIGQLVIVTLSLSLLNAWYYDTSISGDFLSLLLLHNPGRIVGVSIAVATTLYFLLWAIVKIRRSLLFRRAAAVLAIAAASASMLGAWPQAHGAFIATAAPSAAHRPQPDVIVVGLDSLRPDHLRMFGAPFSVTPNLDVLLAESVVFHDTLTTQAHTFPATVSILTGQWPTSNGARGNLFPPNLIRADNSIAHAFRKTGYSTVLAMDETRFANIDQSYGFDTLVGPKIGLMDFLTSAIADNVLVNLLANTSAGHWLFPTIYGNRPVDYSYRPASFSSLLDEAIEDQPGKPLFLYAHYCSAHWPYRTSSLYRPDRFEHLLKANYNDGSSKYLRGLADVDAQLGQLLATLSRQGRLNNAIVVFLSDHGEDFGMEKDTVLLGGQHNDDRDRKYGHGGSATRASQVQVLLGIKRFGGTPFARGVVNGPASLVDVAPTLTALAQLPNAGHPFDGISLVNQINGSIAELDSKRIRYVESSYFPKAMDTNKINAGQVAEEMANQFRLAPQGRVELRSEYVGLQIEQRQRAVFQGEWVLVTRQMDPTKGMETATPFVLRRTDRRLDTLADASSEAPIAALSEAMCQHWRKDAMFAASPACTSLRAAPIQALR